MEGVDVKLPNAVGPLDAEELLKAEARRAALFFQRMNAKRLRTLAALA
jgi:hypothetical protein